MEAGDLQRKMTGTGLPVPDLPFDPDLANGDAQANANGHASTLEDDTAVRPATLGASSDTVDRVPRGQPSLALVDTAEAATEAMKEQFNLLMAKSPPIVQSYVATIKPWTQFFQWECPESGDDAKRRLEVNLVYFAANYLLLLLLFEIIMLFSHPWRLACMSLVLGAWAFYARAGGMDPTWQPRLLGVQTDAWSRALIMSACSMSFLFLVAGDLVLMIVGVSALFALSHAALHPGCVTYSAMPTMPDAESNV
eukprot:TRINITY_DN111196_c0_g1_i1.p1 TRINITY_DN111196_c0_g1~~TRINITY_DN111196_c0_g1_i1.p1  ORF type:complete len:252 (+),score=36.43 TRINITY_DN111196_c0_g1_i1:118-873(+)